MQCCDMFFSNTGATATGIIFKHPKSGEERAVRFGGEDRVRTALFVKDKHLISGEDSL